MRRIEAVLLSLFVALFSIGGNCSRERVESMTQMNEGVVYAQQKRFLEAEERLDRAAAIDATNDQAFYNLALVHMEMENFERAKEDLQRAIAVNGETAGYHEKLGTVLMELEQWEDAKGSFEHAIQLDPNLFKAYYKLAQCYERLDDPQNALAQYTAAIEHGPRFLEAYSQLGRLYADLGFLEQAARVLESALAVAMEGSQEKADVHHLLGTVYQQQGNLEGAVAQFRLALDIDPGLRDALFSLGWTYSLQNEREEARRYLRKYVDVAGEDAPPHYMKAAQDRLIELGEGP